MQIIHLLSFIVLSVIYLFIWDKLSELFFHKIRNRNLLYVVKVTALTLSIYISFLIFGAMEMLMLV